MGASFSILIIEWKLLFLKEKKKSLEFFVWWLPFHAETYEAYSSQGINLIKQSGKNNWQKWYDKKICDIHILIMCNLISF